MADLPSFEIDIPDAAVDKAMAGTDTSDLRSSNTSTDDRTPPRRITLDTSDDGAQDTDADEEWDEYGDVEREDGEESDLGEEDDQDDEIDGEGEDYGDEDEDPEATPEEDEGDDLLKGAKLKFDRKLLNTPELKAAYKELHGLVTRKSQDLSRRIDEVEEVRETANTAIQQFRGFQAMLSDPVQAVDFLVDVGLKNTKIFEKAYEKWQELQYDEDKRSLHLERRSLRAERADVDAIKRQEAEARRQQEIDRTTEMTHKLAGSLGLKTRAQIEAAEEAVANVVYRKGGRMPTAAEIREAVERTADRYRITRKGEKRQERLNRQEQSREAARGRVRNEERARPPRSGARGPVRDRGPQRNRIPQGKDPLEYAIDRAARNLER